MSHREGRVWEGPSGKSLRDPTDPALGVTKAERKMAERGGREVVGSQRTQMPHRGIQALYLPSN